MPTSIWAGNIPTPKTGPNGTIPWAGAVPYGDEAAAINKFMNGQALQSYNSNLPGYANAVGQRSENTASMLKGELPQDVINQIAQNSAERGVGGGQSGGPNSNAAYLRALGLNSLDMMGAGSKELSQSISDTPVPELWNPASLWVPTVLGQQEQAAAAAGLAAGKSAGGAASMPRNGSYITAPGGFGASLGSNWNFSGI